MERPFQRRSFKLKSHGDALNLLLSSLKFDQLLVEDVTMNEAKGRVLAVDVVSPIDVPERNIAVFDGYVIHPGDVKNAKREKPTLLEVVGACFPGDEPTEITRGQGIFTATGGPVPVGPYALIKIENIAPLRYPT